MSSLPCPILICSGCSARQRHTKNSCLALAGVLLVAAATPAFSLAATWASSFGVLAMLPVLPLLWLLFGCSLCLGTVVLKKLLMPVLEEGRPIAMWSADFARWWLVHRAIGMTNHLFARHLRGTAFLPAFFRALVGPLPCIVSHLHLCNAVLASKISMQGICQSTLSRLLKWNFLTMQGARIGEHTFIDSLDLMDLDLVEIEDDVVIGEGTTVLGHSFEGGRLHFRKVPLAPTSAADRSTEYSPAFASARPVSCASLGIAGACRQRLRAAALLHCSGRLEAAVRLHTGPDGKHAY